MGDDLYYGGAYVFKRPRKRKTPAGKRLLFTAAVSLAVCVAVFIFASVKGGKTKIILSAQEIYAVSTGDFASGAAAQRHAAVLRQRGGAGYVYFDEKYYVLAVCFGEKKDAESVVKKLLSSNEPAEVVKIVSPKAAVTFEGDSKQAAALRNALDLFPETFSALCRMSLDSDAGAVSQNDVFSGVNKFVSDTENSLAALEGIKAAGKPAAAAAGWLENLLGILLDLKASRQDPADLRNCAFNVFFCYRDFKSAVS